MKVLFWSVVVLAALVAAAAIVLVAPLPPDRVVLESASPDGEYVAKFSWRPAGLLGWLFGGDNPWVYVTIVNASSGAVVERHSTWGDVPGDACDRLGPLVPWHEASAPITCPE
jgi:hypothetical protein